MRKYEQPWQVMPAKIVRLALEHAEKQTDFDQQISFLLLDVGVESALKTYLVNRKQDVEKIVFSELLRKVSEEAANDKLEIDIRDVEYYHRVRNKLYHQGDGVKPTDENLERYIELAKNLLRTLLAVDVDQVVLDVGSKYTIWDETWEQQRSIEDIASQLREELRSLHECCAIIVEQVRPKFATRRFALEFLAVAEQLDEVSMDVHLADPLDAEQVQLAIDESHKVLHRYNELTGGQTSNYEQVEFMLEDINRLYMRVALKELVENSAEEWHRYVQVVRDIGSLPDRWQKSMDISNPDGQEIYQDYKRILSWIEGIGTLVNRWFEAHIPNVQFYAPEDPSEL